MTNVLTLMPAAAETQTPCGNAEKRDERRACAEDFAALLALCLTPAPPAGSAGQLDLAPEAGGHHVEEIASAPPPVAPLDLQTVPVERHEAEVCLAAQVSSSPPAHTLAAVETPPAFGAHDTLTLIVPPHIEESAVRPPAVNVADISVPQPSVEVADISERPPAVEAPPAGDAGQVGVGEMGEDAAAKMSAASADKVFDAQAAVHAETARHDTISITSLLAETARGQHAARPNSNLKQLLDEGFGHAPGRRAHGGGETIAQEMPAAAVAEVSPRAAPAAHPAIEQTARELFTQTVSPLIALAESIARREERTLRLRLRPEQLGAVELQVTRDGQGRLSARLAAESEAAREALAHGLVHLREALERAGVTIERLEVSAETRLGPGAGHQRDETPDRRAARAAGANRLTRGGQNTDGTHAAPDDRLLNLRA